MKDKFSTYYFELLYLAKRVTDLTDIEGAFVKNRVVKSFLIEMCGEKVLFFHTDDRSKPSLVLICNIPLAEV